MVKTVKEIAEEIGVSKQAIHQEIKRQAIKVSISKPGEQLTLTDEETERIKQAFFARREKLNRQPSTENRQADNSSSHKKRIQVDTLTGSEKAAQQRYIDFLTDQIKAKDEQIRAKDEQIAAMQAEQKTILERLETAQEIARTAQDMAKTAQALHAGTMQQITQKAEDPEGQKIVDPAPAPTSQAPAPDPERSRRWWQFWKA